jgi:hypothetical protein
MNAIARRHAATSTLIEHRKRKCLRISNPPGLSAPQTQGGYGFSSYLTNKPSLTGLSARALRASFAEYGVGGIPYPPIGSTNSGASSAPTRCRL